MAKSLNSRRHLWLAGRLAEYRKSAGLTQAEVAERLGRHQPFVANIESGQRRVDLVELFDFAAIIGFDVADLVEEMRTVHR